MAQKSFRDHERFRYHGAAWVIPLPVAYRRGAVPGPDQPGAEGEHLAAVGALLGAEADDDRVDAGVDAEDLEAQRRVAPDALVPVAPHRVLPADHPAGLREKPARERRGEDHVVGEMAEQRLDVVIVPVLRPLAGISRGLFVFHPSLLSASP